MEIKQKNEGYSLSFYEAIITVQVKMAQLRINDLM